MARAAAGLFGAVHAATANMDSSDRQLPDGVEPSAGEGPAVGAEWGVSRSAFDAAGLDAAPEDFREIFSRYCRPVMGFLRNLVGSWETAEELAQETFIRAYRSRATKRRDTRISTWLFGIAFNVAREAIRGRYRTLKAGDLDDRACLNLQDAGRLPDQALIDKETRNRIGIALARLSEAQRVVFVLKVVNQMRYQEITAITGTRIEKLKTDLHRARLEMRKILEPYMAGRVSGLRGEQ